MKMFKGLIPKEEKYFDDFTEIIVHVQGMAQQTYNLFSSESYDPNIYLKLKPLENRCDEISSRVIKRLNNTFITPFDREDIFSLIKKIDGIGDILLGTVARVDTYSLNEKVEGADKLAAIVLQQIKELGSVINRLKAKEKQINECKAVRDLETEADNVYRASLKKLFLEENNAITLFKKKEILDMLEKASDKCQSTANVIISILIKNS
ncbi:MAG: hypothetical protein COW85_00565 [Ignavibacteria bacterium CG22_combo_CG10-13_8_21_14_all_37_15]|nr:MAG: hypothetical protein COW85_00565 [Ignavibacteria bacterium CG22_combo_CG10-13_8_21_14_all_37_15]PJC58579.1 MAG: hypothetical protein CO025_08800 [Ignavibacteria bacterium CG_4_9_14_0_2_um_filter_37_13]